MIGLALLLAAAAAAPPVPPPAPHNEIVVVGRSLNGLKDDLDRCIAAHCPVRDDVIASVRYAEGLFRSARYQDSRRVLQRAIARDKHGGHDEPHVVAALYEATATVARHEGEQAVAASAIHARARLFNDALPRDSAELLRAEMDEADLTYGRNGTSSALTLYRSIEARARASNQPGIAAAAVLRQAQAELSAGNRLTAARLLDGVIATGGGLPAGYRLAAYAMKTRLPHRKDDTTAVDALKAALVRAPQQAPLLLSAPEPPRPTDPTGMDYYNSTDNVTRASDLHGLRWADIGFAIRPDGTVETAEALRGNLGKDEVPAITANIGKRLYAGFAGENGGRYRIERWTLTADYATPIGSLIRRRSINPHYEMLDVTTGEAAAKRAGATS